MRLAILTCAVFPTEADAHKKLWIYEASCNKYIPQEHMFWYGIGDRFPGYRAMKLDMQLEFLKLMVICNHTHVLYTDSWDAFFTGPYDEIVSKYESMGKPAILSSACWQLANVSNEAVDYPGCFTADTRYKYPHVGGYIAEIPAIIDAFERMLALSPNTGDDCFNWYVAWKAGWFRPMLDSNCEIFQVTNDNISIKDGRLHNTLTGSNPCILHLSGGYTDPVTGKDATLIPWAKELGVIL